MKKGALNDEEKGILLNDAFRLSFVIDDEYLKLNFDLRTAPYFVHVENMMTAFLKDGVVLKVSNDLSQNGFEVHGSSEGCGPFAWRLPLDENHQATIDEFRFYYRVRYAPEIEVLEGYENFFHLLID